MGESDRYLDYGKRKSRSALVYENGELISLLMINLVVFIIMLSIRLMYSFNPEIQDDFYPEILPFFQMPADWQTFFKYPWTILTYVFTDTGNFFIRLFTNMVWLWTFGYIFKEAIGYGKLIGVYIYGGLIGGIFYLVGHQLFPELRGATVGTGMYGANNGVIAIAAAATLLNPQFRIFPMIRGGIPVWILTCIFLAIDLIGGIGSINKAYFLSHTAAIGTGALFALLYKQGKDITAWMYIVYNRFMQLFNPKKSNLKAIKNKRFYETGHRNPFEKKPAPTQERIDAILDKINRLGYDKLTKEEKELLNKYAQE